MQNSFLHELYSKHQATANEIKPALLVAECLKPHRDSSRKRLLSAFRQEGFLADGQVLAILDHFKLGGL